jgi:hypothetical protein
MNREDTVSEVAKVWDRRAMEDELTHASIKIMAQHAEIKRLRAALREYLDADDHLAKVMPERVAEGVIEAAIKRVRAAKRDARAALEGK